jgi:uncharacterized protein (TIGR00369 family)
MTHKENALISSLEDITERARGTLVELMGLEFDQVEAAHARAHIDVQTTHLAPNNFLHAASVIALADTCCGFGALASLPEGAHSFTTIELKANFLGTATEGTVTCDAAMRHGGRTTQVWDAVVRHEKTDKTIALFRCTQMILYAG